MHDYQGPWEDYTLIEPRATHSRFVAVAVVLAIIAIVTGGLIAWSNLS